jgi:hypothetical protein
MNLYPHVQFYSSISNLYSANYAYFVMLGELIYEQRENLWLRVLDRESPTIETTISGTGIINGVEVTDIVTYWSRPSVGDRNVIYSEGQGVILTKEGEMAS